MVRIQFPQLKRASNTWIGDIFASEIQLGGKLHSKRESKSVSGETIEQKSEALKAGFTASLASHGFFSSSTGSYEDQKNSKSSGLKSDLENSMSWKATGGNTLLGDT